MTKRFVNVSLLALALCGMTASAAEAISVTFTDRAAWTTAAGGVSGGENFNSFVTDTNFDGTTLGLASGMTIGTLVADATVSGSNTVDVAPFDGFANNSIDSSPYASMFNGQPGGATTPFMSFSTPVSAFGADFHNLNDSSLRTQIQLFNGATLLETLSPSIAAANATRFFGFVSDQPVTQIRFTRVDNDVFGMDNIQIHNAGPTPVPEPVSFVLLGSGLVGAGLRRWRRR